MAAKAGMRRGLGGLGGIDFGAITANISRTASAGRKFDVAVIGGGSGGLACAKEAASRGASVVLFDHVRVPTYK
jgi:ribulose 1,5-bisphosphate synthetase/thiazole synthase